MVVVGRVVDAVMACEQVVEEVGREVSGPEPQWQAVVGSWKR